MSQFHHSRPLCRVFFACDSPTISQKTRMQTYDLLHMQTHH
nr:MAG TPA: hypothetical protein [Caudoviricetes sp.]